MSKRKPYPINGQRVGTVESYLVYGDEWVLQAVGEIWQHPHRHDYYFRDNRRVIERGGGLPGYVEHYDEGAACSFMRTVPGFVQQIRCGYAQMYREGKLLRVAHGMD